MGVWSRQLCAWLHMLHFAVNVFIYVGYILPLKMFVKIVESGLNVLLSNLNWTKVVVSFNNRCIANSSLVYLYIPLKQVTTVNKTWFEENIPTIKQLILFLTTISYYDRFISWLEQGGQTIKNMKTHIGKKGKKSVWT